MSNRYFFNARLNPETIIEEFADGVYVHNYNTTPCTLDDIKDSIRKSYNLEDDAVVIITYLTETSLYR